MGEENLAEEGRDRVNEAIESIGEQLQRVQKHFADQTRDLEKQFQSGKREVERQTRERVDKLRSELIRNPTVQRVGAAVIGARNQIETRVENVLGTFQIASKGDVERLDKKLSQISRKLKDLEKARRSNGAEPPPV